MIYLVIDFNNWLLFAANKFDQSVDTLARLQTWLTEAPATAFTENIFPVPDATTVESSLALAWAPVVERKLNSF